MTNLDESVSLVACPSSAACLRSSCAFLTRGRDHTVTITHDVKSQKSDQPNRYNIDYSAQFILRDELRKG